MATIQIKFIKDVGRKVPGEEGEILIETEVPASAELVEWGFAENDEKGKTPTTSDGILEITDVKLADEATLTLKLEIIGVKREIKIRHTPASQKGAPLVFQQYLVGYTVQVDFFDVDLINGKEINKPVAGQKVACFLADKEGVKINGSDFTDGTDTNGRMTIRDLPVTDKKLTLHYQIGDQKATIKLNFYDFKSKAARTISLASHIQFLSVGLIVRHIGDPSIIGSIKGKSVSWKLHKVEAIEKTPMASTSSEDSMQTASPTIKAKEEPKPIEPPIDAGDTIINPQGQLAIYGKRILHNERLMLIYSINGDEKKSLFIRSDSREDYLNTSPTAISKSERLSNTTVKIEFKVSLANPTPIVTEAIAWTLEGKDWNMKALSDAKTDIGGAITIPNVNIPTSESVKFWYRIAGKEQTVQLNHNAESRQGKPLVIKQYLEGILVFVDFKSNLDVAKKIVIYKLTEIETKSETTETGRLEIKNVDLVDEQFLNLEYEILGIKRTVQVKHTTASKKGEPLVIVQYLTGVPVKITFVYESDGVTPIANEAIEWNLTDDTGLRKNEAKTSKTDENGVLTIENVRIENQESLTINYQILGKNRSHTFIKPNLDVIKQGSYKEGLEVKIGILIIAKEASIRNPKRLWLTYETRFNWTTFSKTNQKFDLHLYQTDLSKLLLIVAPETDLDIETLTSLRDVFFPDVWNVEDLRGLGKPPWEGRRVNPKVTRHIIAANRSTNIVYIVPAYLPYNSRDNTVESAAIGTKCVSRVHKIDLTPFPDTLEMWNTASRSSIVRMKLPKPIDPFKPSEKKGEFLWGTTDYGNTNKKNRFLEPPITDNELDLKGKGKDFHKKFFSVKTGVNIIGFEVQAGKAKLEHNSILAALRSAYIRDIERRFYPNALNDKDLLILVEIMTVTEVDPNWDDWMFPDKKPRKEIPQPNFGDGYQIRSLEGMDPDKEYFPPTSIPFVQIIEGRVDENSVCELGYDNLGAPVSDTVFRQVDDPEWQKFWEKHYAQALGRAKARLLLRYGLQGFGGNAQNFLLEMEKGVPNGRVVVRDMGDYALHDFVLWALFGPGSGPAPDPRHKGLGAQEDFVKEWKEAFKAMPLLHYECDVLHQFMDDTKKTSEFPTFTGYHRSRESGMHTFNPFCKCCDTGTAPFVGHISPLWAYALPVSPQKFKSYDTTLSPEDWAKIFTVETRWGISHAKAWISYLENALDHTFDNIDWTLLPIEDFLNEKIKDWKKTGEKTNLANRMYQPEAYLQALKGAGYESRWSDLYDKFKTWEIFLGWEVENFLMTEKGQAAIRLYRDRGCPMDKDEPVFRLRVLNENSNAIPSAEIKIIHCLNNNKWIEKADVNGYITINRGKPADYRIEIMGYPDLEGAAISVEDIKNLKNVPGRLDFKYVKIQYSEK